MYHCHIHFYLTGRQRRLFDIIKSMPPLAHFSHEFSESDAPEAGQLALADVIFVNLQEMDVAQTLPALLSGKREAAALVVLAEKSQIPLLSGWLDQIRDIWTIPISEEEILSLKHINEPTRQALNSD